MFLILLTCGKSINSSYYTFTYSKEIHPSPKDMIKCQQKIDINLSSLKDNKENLSDTSWNSTQPFLFKGPSLKVLQPKQSTRSHHLISRILFYSFKLEWRTLFVTDVVNKKDPKHMKEVYLCRSLTCSVSLSIQGF